MKSSFCLPCVAVLATENLKSSFWLPCVAVLATGNLKSSFCLLCVAVLATESEQNMATGAGAGIVVLAGALAASKLKTKRDEAAYVDLYNKLVSLPDPADLDKSDLDSITGKYMTTMTEDVKRVYGIFLEALIPKDKSLRWGCEVC
jgi:Chloroplast envelope transporter